MMHVCTAGHRPDDTARQSGSPSGDGHRVVGYHDLTTRKGDLVLSKTDDLNRFLAGVERRAFVRARLATGNSDDALDVVQDAMLALATRYADRSEAEWGALFHTILQSRLNDWHRRQHVRRRWLTWLGGDDENAEDPLERIADPHALEPAARSAQNRALVTLEAALEELPARQREAFLLRVWEGLDVADTARTMDCSEGSVKTHYSRAVHALREKLGDPWL
jgi:RNA polymerase sigma-70 factor (ECF subfamily)